MWTIHLTADEMALLDSGKSVERKVPSWGEPVATLILQMDQMAVLHLTYVAERT